MEKLPLLKQEIEVVNQVLGVYKKLFERWRLSLVLINSV